MNKSLSIFRHGMWLITLVILFSLTAFGVTSQDHGVDFSGELSIAVWGQIDADPARGDAYGFHQVLQQWNDMYPDVDLKYEIIGGTNVTERFTWINTNLLAGTLPDIVMIYFPGPDITNAADLIYNFEDDLAQPNPYSMNETWRDDFPLDGLILNQTVASDGGNRVVGPTQSGDSGVTAYAYNKTMFDELGIEPPNTWGEFMEIQSVIKDAGYTPFMMPTAGPLGWLWNWSEWTIREQLMDDVVTACDLEEPIGNLNDKELAYCVSTGKLSLSDPRFVTTWELLKDWSQYWQEDFLAPPPEADLFAQGEVAMVNTMNLWLGQIANNPNIDFDWGTFYQPPVTADDHEFGNDVVPNRVGNLGFAGSGTIYVFIPQTTVERSNEQFVLARDLAQWITAPEQVDFWCALQTIPCFEPGTPIDEVYSEPETIIQMNGFFQPGAYENGVAGLSWATLDRALDAEWSRLFVEYMGDSMTIDQALEEFQPLLDDALRRAIRSHPEWEADSWE